MGTERGLGRLEGVGVDVGERELKVHDAHPLPVLLLDPVDRREEATAERTLEVRELDERDGRILRPEGRSAFQLEVGPCGLHEVLDLVLRPEPRHQSRHQLLAGYVLQVLPDLRRYIIQLPALKPRAVPTVPVLDLRIRDLDLALCLRGDDLLEAHASCRRGLGQQTVLDHPFDGGLQQLRSLRSVLVFHPGDLLAHLLIQVGQGDLGSVY
jgi:hypothetical protein